MGAVYRARDPARPELGAVALKLILGGMGVDEARRARFQREVGAMLRLRHPNIVSVIDAGAEQGVPYLVMELIDGDTLEQRLLRGGPLDPRIAAGLTRTLALALQHVHDQGLLHRDLKPANVLLRADGVPLLTDFGLTRELDPQATQNLSQTGAIIGTPGFCPPEQARGDKQVGPAADVYGLGATLYAMLTVHAPFEGESLLGILEATVSEPPPPPSKLRPGIPARLEQVCLRCLAKDPAERPRSAASLAEELATVAGARLTTAPPPSRLGRGLALACALALLAGSALVVRALLRGPRTEPDPEARRLFEEGLALHERGERAGAVERLTAALELDPGFGGAWNARAVVRELQGDVPGALDDWGRALDAELPAPSALYNRALTLAERGDPAAARQDAARLARADPDGIEAAVIEARLMEREGRWQAAMDGLERALRRRADPEAYLARARLYVARGQMDRGLADMRLAVERTPKDDPRRPEMVDGLTRVEETLAAFRAAGFKPPAAGR
jgi:tetratricopeptide (TPR) repeat protein